jgi:prepilin-type N-terminal cleavage/methylation domain-containing protein
MMRKQSGRRGFTLIEIMIVISILSVLILLLLPNYVKAKSRSRLNACQNNIRTMATSVELYAHDNGQVYPTSLAALMPNYMRSINKCPSAIDNQSYVTGYASVSAPTDTYTIECKGSYHTDLGLPANFPRYMPDVGLQER